LHGVSRSPRKQLMRCGMTTFILPSLEVVVIFLSGSWTTMAQHYSYDHRKLSKKDGTPECYRVRMANLGLLSWPDVPWRR
jgi:hypothetical protein